MLLSAGHLLEGKGHHLVIRAVATLRKKGVEVELWIGGGPGRGARYEGKLHELVRELAVEPYIHFLGHVPAEVLAEYMSAADVFCLASSSEGWPNVVNEALACGTPVVASDVGAVPDLIPSPEYGAVVPTGDEDALESALLSALLTSWDRRAIAAWGQSRSWEQVANEVILQAEQGIALNRRLSEGW
jgi:glycosyltransferase involved in cell wall biosynthesis